MNASRCSGRRQLEIVCTITLAVELTSDRNPVGVARDDPHRSCHHNPILQQAEDALDIRVGGHVLMHTPEDAPDATRG